MQLNSELLDGMVVFVRVIEAGSFTLAADQLGHSPSHMSKEVNRLEARLGVRLINRSTRSINLTAAGKTYFERCQQIIIDAKNAELAMGALQETPKGLLKVTAPVSLGLSHLNELIPEFLKQYPEVDLDMHYSERRVDLVANGYDVAIRIGMLKDSSLVARRLGSSKGIITASPDYISRYGEPKTAEELQNHRVISYANIGTPKYWEFTDAKGKKVGVNVNPRLICNSAELELSLSCAGMAISRIPYHICQSAIDNGQLVQILKQYQQTDLGVYAVYPHRQFLSAKVEVFVNFLANALEGKLPYVGD